VHRRLIEPALKQLNEKDAVYFYDLVRRLEFDPRTERFANLVYLVLRDAIPLLPTILDPKILIDDLFAFVETQRVAIEHRIHSPRFIVDPAFLRPMVLLYVKTISDRCWERVDEGEVTPDGNDIWRMNWPYEEAEETFPYEEEDDEKVISDLDQLNEVLAKHKTGSDEK
jgi:hypothetical protein